MRTSKHLRTVVAVLFLCLCAVVLFLLFEEARYERSLRQRTDRSLSAL